MIVIKYAIINIGKYFSCEIPLMWVFINFHPNFFDRVVEASWGS